MLLVPHHRNKFTFKTCFKTNVYISNICILLNNSNIQNIKIFKLKNN